MGDPVQSTFAGTCRKSACNARPVKVDDIFTIPMPRIIGIKYEEQVLEAKSAQSSPTLHLPWWNGLGKIAFRRFSVRDHEFRVHPLCEQPFYRVWLCRSITTNGKLFWSRLSRTPIELEPVGNSMLLGFDASVAERTIKFLCPSQQQIRYVASAGSLRCGWVASKAALTWCEQIHSRNQLFNLACVSLQFYMYSKVILRYRHSPSNRQLVKSKRIWRLRFFRHHTAFVCESIPVSSCFQRLVFAFNFQNRGTAGCFKWLVWVLDAESTCLLWIIKFPFLIRDSRCTSFQHHPCIMARWISKKPPMSLYGETRPSWDFPTIQSSNQSNQRRLPVYQVRAHYWCRTVHRKTWGWISHTSCEYPQYFQNGWMMLAESAISLDLIGISIDLYQFNRPQAMIHRSRKDKVLLPGQHHSFLLLQRVVPTSRGGDAAAAKFLYWRQDVKDGAMDWRLMRSYTNDFMLMFDQSSRHLFGKTSGPWGQQAGPPTSETSND